MTSYVVVDIETASEADIKVGAWAYSEHPSTTVLCLVLRLHSGGREDQVIEWRPGDPLPAMARAMLKSNVPVVAHNHLFERSIWVNILTPRHGFPEIAEERWYDTQARAVALNLPPTLEGAGLALGLAIQKDKDGAKLMRKMAKALPDDRGGWTYANDPDDLTRLIAYCRRDVDVTDEIFKRLPPLHPFEAAVWQVDKRVNWRGAYLDVDFARNCLDVVALRSEALQTEMVQATAGAVPAVTAVPALKAWVESRGVELPVVARRSTKGKKTESTSLDSATIKGLLGGPLPDDVRCALELRAEGGKLTSLAKLRHVETMRGREDGRLRGAFRYYGAHTGRWASSGLQLHNLPKPGMDAETHGWVVDAIRDAAQTGDLSVLRLVFGAPLEIVSKALRAVVAAPPGNDLLAADFSAIEARVIAWLAGQHDILDVFRRGEDVYVYAARRVGSTNRQLGKVLTLALGYGMGAVKFRDTAAKNGVSLTLLEADDLKKKWREANNEIVTFWRAVEDAFRAAIENRGEAMHVGRLTFVANQHFLRAILPSGRAIHYHKPFLKFATKTIQVVNDRGEIEERKIEGSEVRFFTVGRDKVRMEREATYGGKLAENLTQAVSRDLLAAALVRLDATPYQTTVHVHDSVAAEVPEGTGDLAEFESIINETPAWAQDLPMAVEGYRGKRFRG